MLEDSHQLEVIRGKANLEPWIRVSLSKIWCLL